MLMRVVFMSTRRKPRRYLIAVPRPLPAVLMPVPRPMPAATRRYRSRRIALGR